MLSSPRRRFTIQEARALLPAVKEVTGEAAKAIEKIALKNNELPPQEQEVVNRIIQTWAGKIMGLGCVPNGVWLVDFDNGDGFFCWQYGEEDLGYIHSYEAGYAGRTPLN